MILPLDIASMSLIGSIRGPTFLGLLDTLPMADRKLNGPVMMPISEKYKDLGTIVVGKLESGRVKKGDSLLLMPNKVRPILPNPRLDINARDLWSR